MTIVLLNSDDPRTIKALRMAVMAESWPCRTDAQGHKSYLVPSQSEDGISYLSDGNTCGCPDYARRESRRDEQGCKHVLAVRIYQIILKASEPEKVRRHRRAQ